MHPDGAFNGGVQSQGSAPGYEHELEPVAGAPRFAGSGRRHEAAIEGLTAAVTRLRRGVTALRAENHALRLELEELRTRQREPGDGARHDFGELVNIAIQAGPKAPSAARTVVADHLAALVAPRVLQDAQLLISELVTNCLVHGRLSEEDTVLVRILLATDALRLDVENPGVVGNVAARAREIGVGGGFGLQLVQILGTRWGAERDRRTSVWVEMEWA